VGIIPTRPVTRNDPEGFPIAKASKGKKPLAVFVLTHLVEDIHSPLHGQVCNSFRGHTPHYAFADLGEAIRPPVWGRVIITVMSMGQGQGEAL
jgi:hypothetical protein